MSWLPKKNVVVPVDFSESSADAVQVALEAVAQPSDLHVVHVLTPLEVTPTMSGADQEQLRLDDANKQCAELLKSVQASGAHAVVRYGDPGIGVIDYATSVKSELIVIPSHGYHGLKRFMLGSVAEHVIRHADCPVLVLRRRDAE
jgi:nucleotide-binding universal stress UspA family protein